MKKGMSDWILVIIVALVLALIALIIFTPLFDKIKEAANAIFSFGPK